MTQKEEYDAILSIIKDRQEVFIQAIYSLPPKKFFEVDANTQKVHECIVGKSYLKTTNQDLDIFAPKKEYVDKDVELLAQELLEMSVNQNYMELSKIVFEYTRVGDATLRNISGKELHSKVFTTRDEANESLAVPA